MLDFLGIINECKIFNFHFHLQYSVIHKVSIFVHMFCFLQNKSSIPSSSPLHSTMSRNRICLLCRTHCILVWLSISITHGQVYASNDISDPNDNQNEMTDDQVEFYEGGYNYGGGGYDYGDDSNGKSATGPVYRIVSCYVCHYTKTLNHEQGLSNCDDPFLPDGIPLVNCDGFCARTKTKMSEGGTMIIRSCLPNCKNVKNHVISIECCVGAECNSATLSAAHNIFYMNYLCWLLLSIILQFIL